ncbi:MAG: hypothetical protein OIF48_06565 [Silicimonas sp.]|nr:hypothetical protein [Silicimonas sp.]
MSLIGKFKQAIRKRFKKKSSTHPLVEVKRETTAQKLVASYYIPGRFGVRIVPKGEGTRRRMLREADEREARRVRATS